MAVSYTHLDVYKRQIVFCAYQQQQMVIDYAKRYGFEHYIPLVFIKKTSPQVLKANMKIVGATEYALVLYRDKLPKFNNNGKMVKNWFEWKADNSYPKIHPTQKPVPVLKELISIFTDVGDVVDVYKRQAKSKADDLKAIRAKASQQQAQTDEEPKQYSEHPQIQVGEPNLMNYDKKQRVVAEFVAVRAFYDEMNVLVKKYGAAVKVMEREDL